MMANLHAERARSATKKAGMNENLWKKHLSPSRRRALCPFFVQTPGVVQPMLQPTPVVGLRKAAAIAQRARFCRKMSSPCTARHRSAPAGQFLEGPARLDEKLENRRKRQFSKSARLLKPRPKPFTAGSVQTATGLIGRGLKRFLGRPAVCTDMHTPSPLGAPYTGI